MLFVVVPNGGLPKWSNRKEAGDNVKVKVKVEVKEQTNERENREKIIACLAQRTKPKTFLLEQRCSAVETLR